MTPATLRRCAVPMLLSQLLACATASTATRPTERVHFEAPGAAQALYVSTPPAGEAVIGPYTREARGGLSRAEGSGRLKPDPRLAQLAQWVLERRGPDSEPVPHPAVDLWARHLGMPEPAPHLIVLAQSDPSTMADRVTRELERVLPTQRYTHYGIATAHDAGAVLTVLALSWRWAELQPVPRTLTPGQELSIEGTLADDLRDAMLVVSFPDGTSTRAPRQKGRKFTATVPTAQRGEYRVEILAEGELGTTVVANFPVWVGVPAATTVTIERATDADETLDAGQVRERLLALINRDRTRAGLAPLKEHTPLAAVALAHSQDMHDNGFVGHTSPTTGGAGDRVQRAGIRTPYVLENIGRGYSPEEVHRGLMDSPGHRANVMTPDATHVGIGTVVTVEDERAAYLVTELFARFASKIDVASAAEELVALLDAEREKRGAGALVVDDALGNLARATAARFFDEPNTDQDVLLKELSARAARAGRPYRRLGAIMTVVPALDDARGIEALLDPAVRGVGLAVSQGTRPDTIDNGIAIVAVVGY